MKIIDLHAHVQRDPVKKEYLVEELLDDTRSNQIALRMVSAMHGPSIREQNDFILRLCEEHEELIPCAVLNPKEEGCAEEIDRIRENGKFYTVELDPLEHGYIPEMTPMVEEIFRFCEETGMFLKLMTGHGDRTLPAQWEYYISRHPKVQVVFLHMGGFWDGYSTLDTAAKYENVWLDTSECFELSLFRYACKNTAKERILFGSGYFDHFTECQATFFDAFPELTQEDKECFLYRNATRLLKWER